METPIYNAVHALLLLKTSLPAQAARFLLRNHFWLCLLCRQVLFMSTQRTWCLSSAVKKHISKEEWVLSQALGLDSSAAK